MIRVGAIILSFEETEDLSALLPWKELSAEAVYGESGILKMLPMSGLLFLSTCNRVEFIYSTPNGVHHRDIEKHFLQNMPPLRAGVKPRFLNGRSAVRHLLRLATGLESLVLGETEIRAQMKQSFDEARKYNALDSRLRILLQNIFQEARGIRSSISMSNLPLSVATLSVKKLRDKYEELHGPVFEEKKGEGKDAIVVIGSGPMSRQSAQYLSKWAPRLVMVNRSLEKIQDTVSTLGIEAMSFDDFINHPEKIGPVSAIITATSRLDAFITPEFVNRLRNHSEENLILVDLALPPDVDEKTMQLPGINMISLETLRAELEQNKEKRREAALEAEGPIEDALYRVKASIVAAHAAPIITNIQRDVRQKSREKLEQLLTSHFSHLSSREKRLLYGWAIQSNKEINRIHKRGMETVLREYFSEKSLAVAGEI